LGALAAKAPRLHALSLLAARGHYIGGDARAALVAAAEALRGRPGDAEARLMQVRTAACVKIAQV
jgi:hypothetical protein